jgi:protein ImuA
MEHIQYTARPNPLQLGQLRAAIARIEQSGTSDGSPPLPFGLPDIDTALPAGGLARGALHEVLGTGPDLHHAAAAARFAAGVLARLPGPVLWVMERADLFAPGLAGAGLHPDRVVYARAPRRHADGKAGGRNGVLLVMEEGLRHRGLAGVVAELSGPLSLTASRRLQLAAEAGGAMALVLRRPWTGDVPAGATAAATRWQVGALPSAPAMPHAPDVPGLGQVRWRLDLLRCRGGRPGTWDVEACDAQGRLGVVSPLVHRPATAAFARTG